MNRNYGEDHYSTSIAIDNRQGSAGLDLHRIRNGKKDRVASIVFWDSSGQFFVETFNSDVPLDLLEDMIAEAKETIKTR